MKNQSITLDDPVMHNEKYSTTVILFHKLMKRLIVICSIGIPPLSGYGQYLYAYRHPLWKEFLSGVFMGAPFSLGLLLVFLRLPWSFRLVVALWLVFSALVLHFILLPFSGWVRVPILLVEGYAVYLLVNRNRTQ